MTANRRPARKRPPRKRPGGSVGDGRLQKALDETARREIGAALQEAKGSIAEAARLLGLTRRALYKRMEVLVIPNPYRT